jgi:co-chaperonin GroES (HSP10)
MKKTPKNIHPISDRVILENFIKIADDDEVVRDKIIVPGSVANEMEPKHHWVRILEVGSGCSEVKKGDLALVFEPNCETVEVAGEGSFTYCREQQIIAVRHELAKKAAAPQ